MDEKFLALVDNLRSRLGSNYSEQEIQEMIERLKWKAAILVK